MQVQPYLFFEGRCEEALEFYREALGAEVTTLMHFKDNPEPQAQGCAGAVPPPDKVMHAELRIGETTLMASDGMASGQPEFKGMSLSITAANDAEARRLFTALSNGGQVQMPLAKTFWSSSFGMVADRFGVSWMVNVAPWGHAIFTEGPSFAGDGKTVRYQDVITIKSKDERVLHSQVLQDDGTWKRFMTAVYRRVKQK